MSKTILLFVCILFLSSFYHKPRRKFIPPGTVQITEHFFADETEVSNFSWREFEYWTKTKYGNRSAEHLAVLPDTLVWKEASASNDAYIAHYYRHDAYKNYPVVGVSYEQAVAFCKWRTARVKEYYAIVYHKELQIDYRLPSYEEWEFMSNNGTDIFSNGGWNKQNQRLLNCAWEPDSTRLVKLNQTGSFERSNPNSGGDVIAPVYSYWQNRFGLFNMFGNVSEMISEKGTSKGGSWKQSLEQCRPGKDVKYSGAKAWLGFRCVCTLTSTL